MLNPSLCNYNDVHILAKESITITGVRVDGAAKNACKRHKQVTFKNCPPFSDCSIKINNTQVDNAKDLDVMMRMYNLIGCRHNNAKISRRLWQYQKNDLNDKITDSESFKFKGRITRRTSDASNTKDFEITVSLKYLINFWRTLQMSLIYSEINITWSMNCVMTDSTDVETFETADANFNQKY